MEELAERISFLKARKHKQETSSVRCFKLEDKDSSSQRRYKVVDSKERFFDRDHFIETGRLRERWFKETGHSRN